MKHTTACGLAALKELKTGLTKEDWHPTVTDVEVIIKQACAGYPTNEHEVMTLMMSPEDIEDLKKSNTPFESLRLYIQVWCETGKPDRNYIPVTNDEAQKAGKKVMEKYGNALANLAKR